MELKIREISGEISVDDLRLIKRDNIRLWNWGAMCVIECIYLNVYLRARFQAFVVPRYIQKHWIGAGITNWYIISETLDWCGHH